MLKCMFLNTAATQRRSTPIHRCPILVSHALKPRASAPHIGRFDTDAYKSRAWASTIADVERFAPTDELIALYGPSGSGKTHLAKRIHAMSHRANGSFQELSLGEVEEPLAGAALFGKMRGAYTGASERTRGYLQLAHGGTLFIDELAKASLAVQQKLLRVLERSTFRPLGAECDVTVDVRIIVAYNEDLPAMVADHRFSPDLYERIRMFVIEVPPLSDRRADIPGLAREIVARVAEHHRRQVPVLSDELIALLKRAPWTGNIRELDGAMKRIMINAGDAPVLEVRHCERVPGLALLMDRPSLDDLSIEELEREVESSSQSRVARLFGVHPATVSRRLDAARAKRPK